MGIVVPGAGPRRRIIIFPTRVLRVLGEEHRGGWPTTTRHTRRVARAFSRVIAHELIHALTSGLSHSRHGLMRGRLNRDSLFADRLPIDAASRSAVESALDGGS